MDQELAEKTVEQLKGASIDFVTYLPETRLSRILPILEKDNFFTLVPVASEAEAVTIASGAALVGKRPACYMEATGLFVCSYNLLAGEHPAGYSAPAPDISRGKFCRSKKQFPLRTHRSKNGRAAEGPQYRIPSFGQHQRSEHRHFRRRAHDARAQAAFCFTVHRRFYCMNRRACLEALLPLVTDHLVVASVSGQWVWGQLSKHEGNLLLGSMGNALGVGMGMALGLPHRQVIVIESDGSVLLSLFNLPTLGTLHPDNLKVFVFDNEAYSGSRISRPTATAAKTDLAAIARDSGIERAVTVRDLDAFNREMSSALKGPGLGFVVAKIEETFEHRNAERSDVDLMENKYRFVRYVERTEGKPIFLGRG